MTIHAPGEKVLAAATGSTGGLGKIGTIAATTGVMYPCMDAGNKNARRAYWRVQGDQAHVLTFYRSRTRVDSTTLTFSGIADGQTFVVNGLTYTAEDTAGDALYASRKFYTGGADDAADAAELVKLMNADYTVTCASVAVADTVTINNGHDDYVFTAAAAASLPARVFAQAGTDAQDAASLVAGVNDRQTVTCATATAGDTVTITLKGGTVYTFTGHATTTTEADREWDIAPDNTAAAAIATCVNDATYGVPGVTAVASSAVVSFTADSYADCGFTVTSSNGTRLATSAEYGVPGVVAAVNQGGEVYFTPQWAETITVTSSNNTRLAVVDCDLPGITASADSAVVTLAPSTARDEVASVIYAVTGTAAAAVAVDCDTIDSLIKDYWNTAVTVSGANNTTAGTLYKQDNVEGFPYLYCGVANTGTAGTYVVGCTLV